MAGVGWRELTHRRRSLGTAEAEQGKSARRTLPWVRRPRGCGGIGLGSRGAGTAATILWPAAAQPGTVETHGRRDGRLPFAQASRSHPNLSDHDADAIPGSRCSSRATAPVPVDQVSWSIRASLELASFGGSRGWQGSREVDSLACRRCGGRLEFVSLVTDERIARETLESMGLPSEPPRVMPASCGGIDYDLPRPARGRGPADFDRGPPPGDCD
jgi:hypothetical protein